MKNSKKILDLLDQIIWYEKDQDNQQKKLNVKLENKIGESWTLFHLKNLRELYIDSLEPRLIVESPEGEEKP